MYYSTSPCLMSNKSLVFRRSDSQLSLPASLGYVSSETHLDLSASLGFLSSKTHLGLAEVLDLLEFGLLAIGFLNLRRSHETCQVMILLN